jgi:hypothetical protein
MVKKKDHDIINLVSKKSSKTKKCTEIIYCPCNEVYDYYLSLLYVTHCERLLQKSLPLLRQSLVAKELVIEGIRPPPHHTVVFSLPNSATVVPQLQVSWCYKVLRVRVSKIESGMILARRILYHI